MARGLVTRSIGTAARQIPGLKRIPVLKLLTAAEILLLTHDHISRLDRQERRELIELIRIGRGRRRNLTDDQRLQLARLVAKVEPRILAGHAVDTLSPLPLPRRLLYGRRR